MDEDLSPQLSKFRTDGDEPEMSGQRPLCNHCGKPMKRAPITLFCEGVKLPYGLMWRCSCDPREIKTVIPPGTLEGLGIHPSGVDDEGKPVYRFAIRYEYQPQEPSDQD